jgi:TonB family protein
MRKLFIASIILIVLSAFATAAQDETTLRWHWTAPEAEKFAVLMPAPPLRVRRVIPFSDELKLTPPVYEVPYWGVLFSVFSIDKKDAASLKTLEDFAVGLRHAIRHGSRTDESELMFEREVTLDNQTGRQYSVRSDGKRGTAQVYETATRYYALMTLGAQSSDPSPSNFFNSFSLNPKRARAARDKVKNQVTQDDDLKPRAAPEPFAPEPLWPVAGSPSGVGAIAGPVGTVGPDSSVTPSPAERPQTPLPPNTIPGEVLNDKATSKPQPVYPPIARAARASGEVTVEVTVDEEGYVISAEAVDGHPLLLQAAVGAARQARFAPTLLEGKPVKVMGVITYYFVLR